MASRTARTSFGASGGQRIERFRRGKEARLLAYLAAHRTQAHSREQLIEWLWPKADSASGKASLRVALNSLRRRLEPPGTPYNSVLVADRTLVRLNPNLVSTDINEFEAAIQAAERQPNERLSHLERGLALYRGELLPGNLDDWTRDERERYAQMFRKLLGDLVQTLDEKGDLGRAIDFASRAVTNDPLNERACVTLMRLHAQAGHAYAGLALFQKLRCRLRKEFGWEPSPETRLLAKELRTNPRSFFRTISRRSISEASSPLLALSDVPSRNSPHLPSPTTRFFDREKELKNVLSVLGQVDCRLATLTGPPGVGKTRLAIHAAWHLPMSETGRAWFVSLADILEAHQIPQAILAALGGSNLTAKDPFDRIVEFLSGPSALLVLDNFERLVDDGASIILGLLERLPSLSCLVTSRRHLGLPGEHIVDVPILPLPEPDDTLARLAERPSVLLFLDRAQAKAPEFHITDRNRKAVTELVRGLEGIPLALEMAAVWIRVRTPAQMAAELGRRYQLLARNLKGVPVRHNTLQDAVAWSYDLLSSEAKHFLPYLSAFRGSWTVEAAVAVCREPVAEGLLAELQEHSWITGEEEDGRKRFRMLKTLQEFAQQQMDAESQAELDRRHTDYYWQFLEEAKRHVDGAGQQQWVEHIAAEWDNLSAAVSWCLANDTSPDRVLCLTSNLCRFCEIRGYLSAGRSFLEAALAKGGDASAVVRSLALNNAGWLAFIQGDYAVARSHLEGALKAARETADQRHEAIALGNLGLCHETQGRFDEAAACFGQSGDLAREIGAGLFEANARGNLANLLRSQRRYEEAFAQYQECVELFQALGNRRSEGIVWVNMGAAFCMAGRVIDARMPYRCALEIGDQLGDRWLLAACFEGLASDYRPERAVRLLSTAARLRRDLGIPLASAEQEAVEQTLSMRRRELGEAVFLQSWEKGQECPLVEAISWAFEEVEGAM